jgi:uncharacterized protein
LTRTAAGALASLRRMVEVRRSPIHGRGCFAASDIASGQLIGRGEARSVSEDGKYVLWVDGERPVEIINKWRFLNHASDPNACIDDALEVWALRAIKAGEEITIDYGPDWH